jgi:hypothetical protein
VGVLWCGNWSVDDERWHFLALAVGYTEQSTETQTAI